MSLKNWLYQIKLFLIKKSKPFLQFTFLFLCYQNNSQTIANYVSNGGFEQKYNCSTPYLNTAKYWRSIDSTIGGAVFCDLCISNVPNSGFSYQWPRAGQGYALGSVLCQTPQCNPTSTRNYYRNRLKANLLPGKTYCVKLWANLSNPSTYAISNIGFFFVDNSIDTITKIAIPLTYINPQVENPVSNIITDTLNWTLVTGTFVANGTEKNCVIGNFRSDAATTKTLVNSTNLPYITSTILIDDVSCIPLDLPAFAGPDIFGIPNNTVYIGRQRDVGIDEACLWYNLTNTTTPIANAAGITVTVATTTQSYMVKQDICGVIKYDTVVVYASAVGNVELEILNDKLTVFPNPANEILNVEILKELKIKDYKLEIVNVLGQLVREEELKETNVRLNIEELKEGIYFLKISTEVGVLSRKIVIERE